MFTSLRFCAFLAWSLLLVAPRLATAADHAAIAPFLTNDVVGVASLDLTRVEIPAIVDELSRAGFIHPSEQAVARQGAATIQPTYAELTKLGAQRAYLLARVSDVADGGVTWIVEIAPGGKAVETATLLNKWREERTPSDSTAWQPISGFFHPQNFAAISDTIVAAGTPSQIERAKKLHAQGTNDARADVLEALAGLGDAHAGLVIVGDADSRRAIRELFPALPAPFTEINGKLLADDVRSVGVAMTFPPKFQWSLSVETTTPEAATTLEQSAGKGMAVAKALLLKDSLNGPPIHQERAKNLLPLLSLVTPKVEGTRVSVTFGDDEQEIAFMRDFLPAMTQKARTSAYHNARMNRFKQIALGMHNHESAKSAFPANASYDAEGKPLLSWRVHLLPYLELSALYNQFHLDEPWDSEHNRHLIEQMPDVYADPDPAVRATIGDKSRTTFVVPVGEGLIFGGKEGTKFKELTDGSSNTILAVEVVPERSVIWTKPDDWEVDLANPLAGVKREDRGGFTAAFCDGSAHFMGNDNAPETLKALLTPAADDMVSSQDVK